MGTGKFTLYRGTHRKAGLLFVFLLFIGFVTGMLMKHLSHDNVCVVEPRLLGRFVVTPESVQFVNVPTRDPILASHHGVKRCG